MKRVSQADYVMICSLALVLLQFVGCGDTRNEVGEDRPFTSNEVIAYFHQRTGDTLTVRNRFEETAMVGEFESLEVTEDASEKYGTFGLAVHKDIERARDDGLVAGRPDRAGIYWEFHPAETAEMKPYWSATKLYRNVQLTWWTHSRATDERWRRLDQILESMVRSRAT